MLFASKNCSLEKVAFMNSSCFMTFELNWIVFMLFKEKVLQEMGNYLRYAVKQIIAFCTLRLECYLLSFALSSYLQVICI